MCFAALTMYAQRCAVLDFQVGTGVTADDIEGISFNFRSCFRPSGYTMLERFMINKTVENLGYTPTDMSQQQILKVGRNLDATTIVVGTMNKFMDEYYVEIRAIDVSTGITIASEGANFERTAYRASMQSVAENLSKKLNTKKGESATTPSQSSVDVPQGYVDLGLPSGTLWKIFNATGYYKYEEAVRQFGNRLPTKEQYEELKAECQWTWTGDGYKVTGVNGNSIVLPAAGYRGSDGNIHEAGSRGEYWSSTSGGSDTGTYLWFKSESVGIDNQPRYYGDSVRLVMNP